MYKAFIDWLVINDIRDIKQLSTRANNLETWGKFESAEKLRAWVEMFNDRIKEEWDEETSYQPIPMFPPYFEGEFNLDMNGWYHEWELPDGYEPDTQYYEAE